MSPASRLIPAGFGRSVETFFEQSRRAVDGAPELACAAGRLVTAFGLVPRPGVGTASERLGVVATDTAVTGLLEGAVCHRCAPSGQEAGGLDVRDGVGPVRWGRPCLGPGAQRGSSRAGGRCNVVLCVRDGRWLAAHLGRAAGGPFIVCPCRRHCASLAHTCRGKPSRRNRSAAHDGDGRRRRQLARYQRG